MNEKGVLQRSHFRDWNFDLKILFDKIEIQVKADYCKTLSLGQAYARESIAFKLFAKKIPKER